MQQMLLERTKAVEYSMTPTNSYARQTNAEEWSAERVRTPNRPSYFAAAFTSRTSIACLDVSSYLAET